MQQEIKNLHKLGYTNNNWQTGFDQISRNLPPWFAQDIGKTAFDIFDKLNYNVQDIEITGMWGNILKAGGTR